MKRIIGVMAALWAAVGLAEAGKLKSTTHAGPQGFDKAMLQGLVVNQEGVVRLGTRIEALADLKVDHIWAIATDPRGGAVIGTGGDGKIMRVGQDGVVRLVHALPGMQVLSMAVAPDGTIYAGTGPQGHVVRVAPDGTASTWCETGEMYVWALAWDEATHVLYAGTGPRGRLLRIDRAGRAAVHFDSRQEHVLALARLPEGDWAAGTSPRGLLYRVTANGKAQVLFQAPQAEVRALAVGGDALWIGTCAAPPRRTGTPPVTRRSERTDVSQAEFRDLPQPAGSSEAPMTTPRREEVGSGSRSETFVPAPGQPPPSAKEGSVYCLSRDGAVREVLRTKALVLALATSGDRVLVGTGGQGQVFEITPEQQIELVRLDHGQVLALAADGRGGVLLAAGDPGRLWRVAAGCLEQGQLLSEVIDAKALARWGSVSWYADAPSGTKLTLAFRGGNVADPDDTWTDWTAETGTSMATGLPPTRYLQYRVSFQSDRPHVSPLLRGVTVHYQTLNLAPRVLTLEVPDVATANLDQPKRLKIKWTAADPNDDDLVFSVHCRKEGWNDWLEIASELDKREFEWDTTTLPNGCYQVKVVASDRQDNREEETLAGERISGLIVVNHEPPRLTARVLRVEQDRAVIEVQAEAAACRLVSAAYAQNGGKWTPLFPTDGLFDSPRKTLLFRSEPLRPGQHVVMIRVADAAGNSAAADCVFSVRPKTTTGEGGPAGGSSP
ncbi:MAG TPA: hypothetical protein PKD86_04350 [Gemmatales bacterium]|nr:hypothetical protein [Gemmatales bacterium]HMP58563.1 hypothetical protein [Gemmatales bacterium]